MNEWQALGAGFAFYLILEGLMPFFNPDGFKKTLMMLIQFDDSDLKKMGAGMIVIGVVLLFMIK